MEKTPGKIGIQYNGEEDLQQLIEFPGVPDGDGFRRH